MINQTLQRGFTLVEMIIVIILGGIVAAMTVSILTLPINAYIDSARRATLTDVAESSLRRMQRDIRAALPNSIRVSVDGQSLELLHIVDGGRYRAELAVDASGALIGGGGNILDFTFNDTSFAVLGTLNNFASITKDQGANNDLIAIYPLAVSDVNNAYTGFNTSVITNSSTNTNLDFSAHQFPLSSPQQRFFIIDTPVTYRCDISAGLPKNRVLIRYQDYDIQSVQPEPPSSGEAIQANYLSNCQFSYSSGSSSRAGLVTIALSLTDDDGESVRLIHQVHVDNQP
jgi:MSHA biogenesis protein MshO